MSTYTGAQAAIIAIADFSGVVPATHRAADTAVLEYAKNQIDALNAPTTLPAIAPTLSIDASAGVVPPLVVNSRSTDASFIDALGVLRTAPANVSRITHRSGRPAIMMEGATTNALTDTDNFNTANWTRNRCTATAPATASDLWRLEATESNVNGFNIISLNRTIVSGSIQTVSLMVERGTSDWCVMALLDGASNGSRSWFNLATGVTGTNGNFGTGWTFLSARVITTPRAGRFIIEMTVQTTGTILRASLAPSVQTNGGFTCTIGDFALIRYPQVEQGTFATSHTPTTRNADNATTSGTNFTSTYNQSQGTIVVRGRKELGSTNILTLALSTDAANNYIRLDWSSDLARLVIVRLGVEQTNMTVGATVSNGTDFSLVLQLQNNNVRLVNHLAAVATDTTVTLPTIDSYRIGAAQTGDATGRNLLYVLNYRAVRVSNTEADQLAIQNGRLGVAPNQVAVAGQLGTAAFASVVDLLRMRSRMEFSEAGTGVSRTFTVRRPYPYTFAIVEATGSTITARPPTDCLASTGYNVTFNAPVGTLLTYAIIPLNPRAG